MFSSMESFGWQKPNRGGAKKTNRKHGLHKIGGTLLKCMLYVDFDDLRLFFQTCFFWRGWGGGGGVGLMFGMFEEGMKI